MVEAANEAPGLGPRPRLQIEVADVVQYIVILTRDSTDYEEFVLMQNGGVSSSPLGNRAGHWRLSPVRCSEVEHDEIGEVCSVLVLAAEDEQLVALP